MTALEELLASLLGSAGKLVLDLDPASAARLEELDGVSLRFEIAPPFAGPPRILTLLIRDGRFHWKSGSSAAPNVIIGGTLPAIAALLANPDASTAVEISGDEALLARVRDLTRHYEPDLAEPLGRLVGSELADDLLGLAEAGIALLRSAAETVGSGASDSARARYVDTQDFAALLDRLDALKLRTDRLQARVELVEARRAD